MKGLIGLKDKVKGERLQDCGLYNEILKSNTQNFSSTDVSFPAASWKHLVSAEKPTSYSPPEVVSHSSVMKDSP